jgi:hypothetical protein
MLKTLFYLVGDNHQSNELFCSQGASFLNRYSAIRLALIPECLATSCISSRETPMFLQRNSIYTSEGCD